MWSEWKKAFDAWESSTAKWVEEWMKSPLVLGPGGAMLTAAMKAKKAADDAKAQMLGPVRPAHQARSGAHPAPAQPAPEPHHGPRGEARVSLSAGREREGSRHGHHAVPGTEDRAARRVRHARRAQHATALHAPRHPGWAGRLARRHLGRAREADPRGRSLPRLRGPQERRAGVRLRAQPRRVDERRAGHPGSRRRDGARLRVEHGRAGGVRHRALATRACSSSTRRRWSAACSQSWDALGAVERIVLLDDGIDVGKLAADLRDKGHKVPPFSDIERKIVPWSRALQMGRARDQEDAERVRAHDARRLARSAGDDALHERHQRQPQGRAAHAPQRVGQRPRLAQDQRAAARRARRRPALAADEPHLRLRRGVPGQHPGLHHVHGRPARRVRAAARWSSPASS